MKCPIILQLWDVFFKLMETIEVPEDFMADCDNELPPDRDLF
jgi:hypothetical protein